MSQLLLRSAVTGLVTLVVVALVTAAISRRLGTAERSPTPTASPR